MSRKKTTVVRHKRTQATTAKEKTSTDRCERAGAEGQGHR